MCKTIAIIVNLTKEKAISCGKSIINLLQEDGVTILMHSCSQQFFTDFSVTYYESTNAMFEHCDAAVTIGGDGTIIHNAKFAALNQKPLIGVNVGRLGFAAELEPDEIMQLKRLVTGDFKLQKRMLLEVSVYKQNCQQTFIAVNDAVISRGNLSRIIDLSVYLKEENVVNYRADGLVISTPTGSTAYALSAGGPVIEPQMKCILLTPICSHSLYARSVVFSDEAVLTVFAAGPESGEYSYLTIDGQESLPLEPNDKVEIKMAKEKLELITLKDKNFYKLVSEKLKGRED